MATMALALRMSSWRVDKDHRHKATRNDWFWGLRESTADTHTAPLIKNICWFPSQFWAASSSSTNWGPGCSWFVELHCMVCVSDLYITNSFGSPAVTNSINNNSTEVLSLILFFILNWIEHHQMESLVCGNISKILLSPITNLMRYLRISLVNNSPCSLIKFTSIPTRRDHCSDNHLFFWDDEHSIPYPSMEHSNDDLNHKILHGYLWGY